MEIGPTQTPNMYSCMSKLNDYLPQLYNYYANLIDKASYVVGNVNPNLPSSSASTSATKEEDNDPDGFKIWSTLSFTQISSRNINELQFYLQK